MFNKFLVTHSEYVILTAFPPQQRLHERSWVLRCTNIDKWTQPLRQPS